MKSKLIAFLLVLISLNTGVSNAEPAAKKEWTEPKTGMEFVWVPAGCFNMGGDDARDQPVHKVCVEGFWMGKYEVTQGQYQKILHSNPSHFQGTFNPVEEVNVEDVTNFIEEMGYRTGIKVRLPTEAEWEYACRAGGAHEKYCGAGSQPDRLAWLSENSNSSTHAVGQLDANEWGLYDMSGNVWEWTQDCWNENYVGAPADGSAWKTGDCDRRVLRGGSWFGQPTNVRAVGRNFGGTANHGNGTGFRVVKKSL